MGGPTPAIDEEGGDSTSADLLGQPSLVEGDSPAQEDPLEPTQPTGDALRLNEEEVPIRATKACHIAAVLVLFWADHILPSFRRPNHLTSLAG